MISLSNFLLKHVSFTMLELAIGSSRVSGFVHRTHWTLTRRQSERKCGHLRDGCTKIDTMCRAARPTHHNATSSQFVRGYSDRTTQKFGAGTNVGNCKMQTQTDNTVGEDTSTSLNLLTHSTYVLRSAWQTAISRTGLDKPVGVDATAGRGSDTLSLCRLLGPSGVVHSVDIQEAAIGETRSRYEEMARASKDAHESVARLVLHQGCHSDLRARIGGAALDDSVAVVAYNLGWYPGANADRSIITRAESTVRSLTSAQRLLAPGGVISVMVYVGHDGGEEEEEAVYDWATNLCPKQWTVVYLTYPNRNLAPTLLLCERRR